MTSQGKLFLGAIHTSELDRSQIDPNLDRS